MPTCTAFNAAPLTDDMSGALEWTRITVTPGMVLHEDGVRRLVLNTWYSTGQFGEVQNLQVVALSHDDSMGILKPWNSARSVTEAQRATVKAECPQPNRRRWWLAVSLDDQGRYQGANGFRESHPCEMCAPSAIDPDLQTREPCRTPRAHAWNQVGHWDDYHRSPGRNVVLAPIADTLDQAREIAREICERIRTVGHL